MPDEKKFVLVNMSQDNHPIMGEPRACSCLEDIIQAQVEAIYEQGHDQESAKIFQLVPLAPTEEKKALVQIYRSPEFQNNYYLPEGNLDPIDYDRQRTDQFVEEIERELSKPDTKFLYAFTLTEDSSWSDTAQMTVSHQLVEAHNYKEAEEKMWAWVNNLYNNYKDQWEELDNSFWINDEEERLRLDLTKPVPVTKEEWCKQRFEEALLKENPNGSKRT